MGRQDSQWLEGWSLEMGSEAGEAWGRRSVNWRSQGTVVGFGVSGRTGKLGGRIHKRRVFISKKRGSHQLINADLEAQGKRPWTLNFGVYFSFITKDKFRETIAFFLTFANFIHSQTPVTFQIKYQK